MKVTLKLLLVLGMFASIQMVAFAAEGKKPVQMKREQMPQGHMMQNDNATRMQGGRMQQGRMMHDKNATQMQGGRMQEGHMMQGRRQESSMMHANNATRMQYDAAYSDRGFLSAMIPHHEAAISMAQDVLAKGKDPQVKKWAEEIIQMQKAEIQQMQTWLVAMGGEAKDSAKMMEHSMQAMLSRSADTLDADRNFVIMMIEHHAAALEMSTGALVHSGEEKVVQLAHDIIKAQAQEIAAFKNWLRQARAI